MEIMRFACPKRARRPCTKEGERGDRDIVRERTIRAKTKVLEGRGENKISWKVSRSPRMESRKIFRSRTRTKTIARSIHGHDGKRRDASGRIFDGEENETMVARKARLVSRGRVKSSSSSPPPPPPPRD